LFTDVEDPLLDFESHSLEGAFLMYPPHRLVMSYSTFFSQIS